MQKYLFSFVSFKLEMFRFFEGHNQGGIVCTKGPFTNYVYKRRGVGGQKNQLFVNFYTIEIVNGGG